MYLPTKGLFNTHTQTYRKQCASYRSKYHSTLLLCGFIDPFSVWLTTGETHRALGAVHFDAHVLAHFIEQTAPRDEVTVCRVSEFCAKSPHQKIAKRSVHVVTDTGANSAQKTWRSRSADGIAAMRI